MYQTKAIFAAMILPCCTPAMAGELLIHETALTAQPRPVASFNLARWEVEMLAVTRRARADTAIRRAHLDDCETMAKVMPGYPQPAYVSIDFRVNF